MKIINSLIKFTLIANLVAPNIDTIYENPNHKKIGKLSVVFEKLSLLDTAQKFFAISEQSFFVYC